MGEQLPRAATAALNGHAADGGYVLKTMADLLALPTPQESNTGTLRDPKAAAEFALQLEAIGEERRTVATDLHTASGRVTDADGAEHEIQFIFSRFVSRSRYTDADIALLIDDKEVYAVRAPIDSLAEQERLARMLERMYPASGASWVQLVNAACGRVRDAYLSAAVAVPIESVPVDFEDLYLVEGFVPLSGVTILYGLGGFGKGWIAHALANAICAGVPFLDRDTKQSSVLYLDYEDTQQIAGRRNHRLGLAATTQRPDGSFFWMSGRGIPVVDQLETIRREIAKTRAGVVIVDSALPALGGNASDAEAVSRLMYHALDTLGVPVVLIAHVNRAEDERYPFGSIYWHNAARMTWHIKRADSNDSPHIQVALFHKKANNGRRQPPFGIEFLFDDPHGPVDVQPCDPDDVIQLIRTASEKPQSMAERIWDLLEDGPKTPTQLAEALPLGADGKSPSTNLVRNNLSRMLKDGRFVGLGKMERRGKEQLWQRTTGRTTGSEQGVLEGYV